MSQGKDLRMSFRAQPVPPGDIFTPPVTLTSAPASPAAQLPQPFQPSQALRSLAPRRPSRFLLRFFDLYLSLYIPLHFRALRIAHPERFPVAARPLIVVINHPSWWDPLSSILLSRFFLRHADHYAPIDALSLPRHRILAGLGCFPVEQGTPRGAAQFLRAARHILADTNSVLWLTPQGSFTDIRTRPILLKSGLASLLKRLDQVTVVPIVFEYPFWNERKPEMLSLCGTPLHFRSGHPADPSSGPQEPADAVAAALAAAQDELAALAIARQPAPFTTILAGEPPGTGPLSALWLRLSAALRAQPAFDPVQPGTPAAREQPRP